MTDRQCRRGTDRTSHRCGEREPTRGSTLWWHPTPEYIHGATSATCALDAGYGRTVPDAPAHRPHSLA